MHKLIILIETPLDQAAFDDAWPQFLHWAEQMPGLRREVTSKITRGLYGSQSYSMIHELIFDDTQAAIQALNSPQGQSAGQILQTITQGRVTLIFADHLEDSIENLQRARNDGEFTEGPEKLTPADLQTFMEQHAIPGEILLLDSPTPTVELAAEAVGARPDQIVKSLLFLVDGKPILVISCGTAHIDGGVVAAHRNVGRKRARLASPDAVLAICGYEVGALPPFGHLQQLTTLMDPQVLQQPEVYAGGGAESALVRLNPVDIQRITQATVADLRPVG